MIMFSKFSNFPDELSKNDELREYKLSGSDCSCLTERHDMHKKDSLPGSGPTEAKPR